MCYLSSILAFRCVMLVLLALLTVPSSCSLTCRGRRRRRVDRRDGTVSTVAGLSSILLLLLHVIKSLLIIVIIVNYLLLYFSTCTYMTRGLKNHCMGYSIHWIWIWIWWFLSEQAREVRYRPSAPPPRVLVAGAGHGRWLRW